MIYSIILHYVYYRTMIELLREHIEERGIELPPQGRMIYIYIYICYIYIYMCLYTCICVYISISLSLYIYIYIYIHVYIYIYITCALPFSVTCLHSERGASSSRRKAADLEASNPRSPGTPGPCYSAGSIIPCLVI